MLVNFLNGLFSIVELLFESLIMLLPHSPFNFDLVIPDWARWPAVFIPWQAMIAMTASYTAAVLLYYVVRVALRWIKAVGS